MQGFEQFDPAAWTKDGVLEPPPPRQRPKTGRVPNRGRTQSGSFVSAVLSLSVAAMGFIAFEYQVPYPVTCRSDLACEFPQARSNIEKDTDFVSASERAAISAVFDKAPDISGYDDSLDPEPVF